MTAAQIIDELRRLGTETYKKILLNHGVSEPVFGVKIEELKRFQKQIKRDYELSRELYDSGVYDAQYLAGLIADPARMTKRDLRHWLAKSNCMTLCGVIVAGVLAESRYGWELALEWIDSKSEKNAATGWNALSGLVSVTSDEDLDVVQLKELLRRIETTIHEQPNQVRYTMNGFVIAVGVYVKSLTPAALKAAEKIGVVTVDMGATACKVPLATEYIKKVQHRGTVGKKRKSALC